jgi:hypothetical protein
MKVYMVAKIIKWFKGLFKSKPVKVKKRFISDDEFNDMKKKREDKLNSILDRISKEGYDSLSQHEKNFLNNYKK